METFTTFVSTIFGAYNPIVHTDEVTGVITEFTDWGYVASVVIFCIVLYFVLKTIGGVLYEWLR